jgi:hypothetical protein
MATNDLSGIGGAGSGGITSGPGGTGITYTDVTTGFRVQTVQLTLLDITNKYITLATVPSAAGKVKMSIKGGFDSFYFDDFVIAGDQLSWAGTELDGVLENGDKLQITYFAA